MDRVEPAFYQPALRMKRGELGGLRRLASDVTPYVLSRVIIPPPKERDADLIDAFHQNTDVPNPSSFLVENLGKGRIILDAEFLYKDYGEESSKVWMPKMFEAVRAKSFQAIPTGSLTDLLSSRVDGLRASIDPTSSLKFAIRVSGGDLIDPVMFSDSLKKALERIWLTPQDCIITADFKGSGFQAIDIAADVIEGAMDVLQEFGRWQKVAFQGTSYPLTNPAAAEADVLVPRKEWQAWKKAVDFDNSAPEHFMFGDYAPDHSKMEWNKKGGVAAHRCYRYTTENDWYIVRGSDSGQTTNVMEGICKKLVASQHYAGRTFSYADEQIYQIAKEATMPGSSTDWREINVCHHITRVVRDMGKVKGIKFADTKSKNILEQLPLL